MSRNRNAMDSYAGPTGPTALSASQSQRAPSQVLRRTTPVLQQTRFRPCVTGTTTTSVDIGEQEIFTTTEIVRTRNGGSRIRIVKHDAKTGDRLTPFLPSGESDSEEEQPSAGVSTDFDRTTAAAVATSSPATLKEASSDGDTEKAVTDKLGPASTAATDDRSPDRTEEAEMQGTRHKDDYSEVTDSGQEVEGHGGEGDGEEEEEGEEEQQYAQYRTRGAGNELVNKIINRHTNGNTRDSNHTQAGYSEGAEGGKGGGEDEEEEEEEEGEEEGEEDEEEEEEEEEGEYDEEDDLHRDDGDHKSVTSAYSEDQSDSEEDVDDAVREEMDSFCRHFKGIDRRFRLISKIGEGTFSSVYKAEDLLYDRYENDWDLDASDDGRDRSPPPNKRRKFAVTQRRRPKYVAIKKIYVTSSPQRIMNELELLHELWGCRDVVPLITAFRHLDQVVAILPYFKHVDFRNYFRALSFDDMRLYFKSLFSALSHVHRCKIIHRDIKPTNFLYDYARRRGVLVDFGLAEREGTDWSHCPCQHSGLNKSQNSLTQPTTLSTGYIKNDSRPSRRANRAGTRGFRAPEVLFKCTSQTTKIDIWSAGVVLLTMLSKRFPFFNSADDIDATIEIATIFGKARMRSCALLHGAVFETNIPTIGEKGFALEKIIMWATNRIAGGGGKEREKDELREANMSATEKVACGFLARCLELDPAKRIDADGALEHEFLRGA